jgi:conjugal transfer pilin signal peptidase TrbI
MERPLARCEPFHRLGYGAYLAHFDGNRFRSSLRIHVRRWRSVYLLVASVAFAFDARYTIGLNVTASLPYRLFIIDKGDHPERSQYVAFRWPGGGPYAAGATFVKQIIGIPGDVITRVNRSFFVNGHPVGLAKPMSQSGQPLALGPTGSLPTGRYYVRAPHPDSLDSRYALLGWIAESQIIGRAYVLF